MFAPTTAKIIPRICVLDVDGHTLAMLNRVWRESPNIRTMPTTWHCRFQSAVDIDEWLSFNSSTFGSIGIVDFGSAGISDRVVDVLARMNQSMDLVRRSNLIAVGSRWMESIERELQLLGFAMVVCSKSEFDRIRTASHRYWQALEWPETTIEERLASSLPWNPAE